MMSIKSDFSGIKRERERERERPFITERYAKISIL
jgi:hypothetical protein